MVPMSAMSETAMLANDKTWGHCWKNTGARCSLEVAVRNRNHRHKTNLSNLNLFHVSVDFNTKTQIRFSGKILTSAQYTIVACSDLIPKNTSDSILVTRSENRKYEIMAFQVGRALYQRQLED